MDSLPAACDVAVLGAGPAGVMTALEAARSGADVALFEATDEVGGNAPRSTGYVAAVGTALQRHAGITDSVEGFMDDARREVERERHRFPIVYDEALTRRYAEASAKALDCLSALGVQFDRLIPRPRQHSVDRLAAIVRPERLSDCFAAALKSEGVQVVPRTRARRLLREGRRVVGVELEGATGHRWTVSTRRAVVLAAGGYQANHELRRRYQSGDQAEAPYVGLPTCKGDGHVMGQAVGGDAVNMTMVPMLVRVASALVEDCIAVNADGRRFHDEAGPYRERLEALEAQPGGTGYYVCDAETVQRRDVLVRQMPVPAVRADTIDELARIIGVPGGALADTLAGWNTFLASGSPTDSLFGRVILPAGRRTITAAPFAALRMVPGVTFPAGGFRVTPDSMQVLDVFGDAVTGLHAVGDCVGGVNPVAGLGGIHLGSAFTLGRVAGRAAADHSTENATSQESRTG